MKQWITAILGGLISVACLVAYMAMARSDNEFIYLPFWSYFWAVNLLNLRDGIRDFFDFEDTKRFLKIMYGDDNDRVDGDARATEGEYK